MFQFTGFAVLADSRGFPIRTPADLRPFAPTRGFSQLTASFFASVCLGIHRAPYLAFSLTPAWGARGKAMPNARIQSFPLASRNIAAARASSLRRTSNNFAGAHDPPHRAGAPGGGRPAPVLGRAYLSYCGECRSRTDDPLLARQVL
jgi:hypothetical protein